MNIKDYAAIILSKENDPQTRLQAIARLQHGMKHEGKWNDDHRREVAKLIAFLQSPSNNIEDLEKYSPVY